MWVFDLMSDRSCYVQTRVADGEREARGVSDFARVPSGR